MLTRRNFMKLCSGAGISLMLPGCAVSPPLRKDIFPDFGSPDRPYLGLATSLREEHDYEARVEGTIPAELRGTLYRNGPGLFDRAGLRKRNLLDGDGMVQSFTIHDKGVHYLNRFVRTQKYRDESAAGRFIYPSWSTQAPGGLWANFWAADLVKCQAGVTTYLRNGRLYAFDDTGLPYELDPTTLETVGESRLGLPEGFSVYSAHSKIDPLTGEWLHFGTKYGPNPRIHFTIFGKDGGLKSHRVFPSPRYVYMHDWFVSDRHLILQFHPAEIAFWGFLLGRRSMADSLHWRPEEGNLMMVLEREGDAAPLFLHTDACFMWHSVNAYEKGRTIIADFIGYENPDHFIGPNPVATAVMAGRRGEYNYPGALRRYLIDPVEKSIRMETLDLGSYEWPRVNELHRSHRYRFAYLAKCREGEFFWSYITRVDMETGRSESCDFGEGVYCTEPVFAPKPGFPFEPDSPSEPGWILSEVYDSRTKKSFLAVLDAERVASGPLAVIHLTHHAPFSYHGFWQAAGS